MSNQRVDVVVVGGGLAGSVLAGVLARAGVRVLVAEKERRFRDRVRGEATVPWGVAEAVRLGVAPLFQQAGGVELVGMRLTMEAKPAETHRWAEVSVDGLNEVGFSHHRLQEVALSWAESMGATARRPAKVTDFSHDGTAAVTVTCDGRSEQIQAKLVVGADGKMSRARAWAGGNSAADPEHHRFGGVAVSGVSTNDRDTDNFAGEPGLWVNWFAQSAETTRLYLVMAHEHASATGADRGFEDAMAVAARYMPDGSLDGVRQEGPIGFFSNADTWATQIAGNNVVLIGDAAGSVDPTQGQGTALLFRDARELSDLLLADDDWPAAIREYAERRKQYFEVLRQYDLWCNAIIMQTGAAGDRLREGNQRATEADPTLGGFAFIEARGPDGLTADAAARAMYFGEASEAHAVDIGPKAAGPLGADQDRRERLSICESPVSAAAAESAGPVQLAGLGSGAASLLDHAQGTGAPAVPLRRQLSAGCRRHSTPRKSAEYRRVRVSGTVVRG